MRVKRGVGGLCTGADMNRTLLLNKASCANPDALLNPTLLARYSSYLQKQRVISPLCEEEITLLEVTASYE